jgi:hypothetical protein
MSRHANLTCPGCQHTAPVHEFLCDRDGRLYAHHCLACELIPIHDGLLLDGASPGFQLVHALSLPADLQSTRRILGDIQGTIPLVSYIDAITPDPVIHGLILEELARIAPALFWVGNNAYLRNGVTGQLYLVERDPETGEPTGKLIPVDAVSNDPGGSLCPK